MNGINHEELSRCLFEESNDAFFIFDPDDNQIVDANPTAQRLTGLRRKQLLGTKLGDLLQAEGEHSIEELIAAYRSTGIFHSREGYSLRCSADGDLPVNLSISRIHTSPKPLGLVVARDIRRRKQIERELRSSQDRFKMLFEYAPDAYYLNDMAGNFVDGNMAAEELIGYKRDELIGENFLSLNLLPLDQLPKAAAALQKSVRGEPTGPDEFILNRRDSGQVVVEIRTYPIAIDGQKLVLGIARDISQRKRAEEALEKANDELEFRVAKRTEQLEELNRQLQSQIEIRQSAEQEARLHRDQLAHVSRVSTMGEIATGIAHELNQPLTAIGNQAFTGEKVLQNDDSEQADKLRGIFQFLSQQVDRAGEIVKRLRSFIKKSPSYRSLAELNEVVEEVVRLMEPELRRNRIQYSLELEPSLPSVVVDVIQIQQVLVNLVQNAIDAMAEIDPGQRTLTIATSAPGSNAIVVAIGDSGPGVPPDETAKIFDAFYSTKEAGLGMGLAISRSIIDDHGGRLWVESGPQEGATFFFRVPLEDNRSRNEESANAAID